MGVRHSYAFVPFLFVMYVDDLVKNLPSGVHPSLNADYLAIWSSDHLIMTKNGEPRPPDHEKKVNLDPDRKK